MDESKSNDEVRSIVPQTVIRKLGIGPAGETAEQLRKLGDQDMKEFAVVLMVAADRVTSPVNSKHERMFTSVISYSETEVPNLRAFAFDKLIRPER